MTPDCPLYCIFDDLFLLTRPLRDVTTTQFVITECRIISTHTPLAGRDRYVFRHVNWVFQFLLTRPLRDVTTCQVRIVQIADISTHTPLAGRDIVPAVSPDLCRISTHTPLAGRDNTNMGMMQGFNDFYSHAPCGT